MDNIDIIFASKFKVAANAIKKLCNSAQISCYTLLDDSEKDYIFKDLKPKLYICTESYHNEYGTGTLSQLKEIGTIQILCSDNPCEEFDITWPKEVDTFNFVENVKELLLKEDIDG